MTKLIISGFKNYLLKACKKNINLKLNTSGTVKWVIRVKKNVFFLSFSPDLISLPKNFLAIVLTVVIEIQCF